MKELLGDIERWRSTGRRVALARVIGVEGSGPLGPGAAMAVSDDGEVAGSVSGGCVEGAVVEEALAVISSGRPRLCSFGYSDDEAFAVGLTCGGTLRLFVEPIGEPGLGGAVFEGLAGHLLAGEPVALATVLEVNPPPSLGEGVPGEGVPGAGVPGEGGPGTRAPASLPGATLLARRDGQVLGTLGEAGLDDAVVRDALGQLDAAATTCRHYGPCGEIGQQEVEVFLQAFAPPPQLLVFGAVDFAAALARVAKVLGFRVTVCDARAAFATPKRFPMADQVVVEWPDRYLRAVGGKLTERDAVCVLTHDPKFDVPVIEAALGTAVGYIGAMGSRRTTTEREKRLREGGVDDAGMARVMAQIGLDIGARTPEETAVSICAEIISLRAGAPSTASLSRTGGPIHHQPLTASDQP